MKSILGRFIVLLLLVLPTAILIFENGKLNKVASPVRKSSYVALFSPRQQQQSLKQPSFTEITVVFVN